MNSLHQKLLADIQKYAGKGTTQSASDSYLSSGHFYYSVSVPIRRKIAKDFAQAYKDIDVSQLLELLNSLIKGKSHEEITLVGTLLDYFPKQRQQIDPNTLD